MDQSGIRVLIALDDFDELPHALYHGTEANALFLFLRSVIDQSWLSILFIGSEVLPTIMSAQAHKLNQVSPYTVSNFQSSDATGELLAGPTRSRMEWHAGAIAGAHYLTDGNPYYLTLVGQEVWRRMRELDRTMVGYDEVDQAVGVIAQNAPGAHFMHLWADSADGVDSAKRSAIVGAAVLCGIARASGPGSGVLMEG